MRVFFRQECFLHSHVCELGAECLQCHWLSMLKRACLLCGSHLVLPPCSLLARCHLVPQLPAPPRSPLPVPVSLRLAVFFPSLASTLLPSPHQIVMSRTFGNASPHGGVGVRMCVPLIDMLNHAGDEAAGGLLSTNLVIPRDNVRWDVVSPDHSSCGGWEMVLKATQDIAAGSPLALSYREGPNEEFLQCYGFVPASNPHDTVTLFGGLSAALEHLWQQDLALVSETRQVKSLSGCLRARGAK